MLAQTPSFTLTKPKDVRGDIKCESSSSSPVQSHWVSRLGRIFQPMLANTPVRRQSPLLQSSLTPSKTVRTPANGRALPGLFLCLIEGRSPGTAGFIESRPSSVNRFPVERRRQADRDELFRCMDCSGLQREGVDRNGKSFFDDAADQRRNRGAYHLSRDARRLTQKTAGSRAGGRPDLSRGRLVADASPPPNPMTPAVDYSSAAQDAVAP